MDDEQFSFEERIALYIIGKLAIEDVWTREQLDDYPGQALLVKRIAEALQESLPTFTADTKTSFRQLCEDADPVITHRMHRAQS